MLKTTNATEEMIEELVEIETVLAALDQYASTQGSAPSRAACDFYGQLVRLRDGELRDWNDEASSGLKDPRRMLYRCDEAGHPYHTDNDGPCEVWTPNWDASAGKGAVSLCDLHEQMRIDAGGEESPAAKSRRLESERLAVQMNQLAAERRAVAIIVETHRIMGVDRVVLPGSTHLQATSHDDHPGFWTGVSIRLPDDVPGLGDCVGVTMSGGYLDIYAEVAL